MPEQPVGLYEAWDAQRWTAPQLGQEATEESPEGAAGGIPKAPGGGGFGPVPLTFVPT